jgi:copper chaperone CopZ
VREEIGDIPGINTVDVNLDSGTVIIKSDGPVAADVIKAAVEEAGYQLVG